MQILIVLLLIALVALTGCRKKAAEVEPTPPPPVEQPAPPPEPKVEVKEDFPPAKPIEPEIPPPSIAEINRQLKNVYFDYDKYDLDDEDRAVLQNNATVLMEHGSYSVVIEGHCDERGTIEYNLALGERRANSVRDYLTSLGVSPSRIRIISFGEEKPAAQGSNEMAWSKNRRAEFKLES